MNKAKEYLALKASMMVVKKQIIECPKGKYTLVDKYGQAIELSWTEVYKVLNKMVDEMNDASTLADY